MELFGNEIILMVLLFFIARNVLHNQLGTYTNLKVNWIQGAVPRAFLYDAQGEEVSHSFIHSCFFLVVHVCSFLFMFMFVFKNKG